VCKISENEGRPSDHLDHISDQKNRDNEKHKKNTIMKLFFLISAAVAHVALAPEPSTEKLPAAVEQEQQEEEEKKEKPKLTLASFYARSNDPHPLPAQGFEGKNVKHENFETVTKDWRTEYGPNGPGNRPHPESGAHSLACISALLFLLSW